MRVCEGHRTEAEVPQGATMTCRVFQDNVQTSAFSLHKVGGKGEVDRGRVAGSGKDTF